MSISGPVLEVPEKPTARSLGNAKDQLSLSLLQAR